MSHYCWKCGQYLANEKFSSKGHARHICKKCMAEERAHRRQILKKKRERGEIPELKLKPVSQEIIDYVEREIIPRYASFDKAHQEDPCSHGNRAESETLLAYTVHELRYDLHHSGVSRPRTGQWSGESS